jgi:hypothetical protein
MDAALFSCGVPPFDNSLNRCFKYQKEAIMANAIWKKDGGQGFRFQVSGSGGSDFGFTLIPVFFHGIDFDQRVDGH